jgi:hypothetical protein
MFRWIEALAVNKVFPTPEYNSGLPALNSVIVYENPSARNPGLTAQLIDEIVYTFGNPNPKYPRTLKACDDGPPNAEGKIGCPYKEICIGQLHQIDGAEGQSEPPIGFTWRKPHHAGEEWWRSAPSERMK